MDKPQFTFPRYPSIIFTGLAVIASRMLGHKRSLRSDALRMTGRIFPPINVEGIENIPTTGGYLIVVNHYARPGYNTAWNALSLAAVIPQEITYIMSEEWAFTGNLFGFLLRPLMRSLLASINWVYDFLSMPSMVEGLSTPLSRAAAVRRVIVFVRTHPNAIIGLAPEGQDSPRDGIELAPAGGGKFMLQLNRIGLHLLPVTVAEYSGQLTVRFGKVFDISIDPGFPPGQVDEYVRSLIRDRLLQIYASSS
jgi:1-acyl-sn-glycerol-3-phosphate acyltransferase